MYRSERTHAGMSRLRLEVATGDEKRVLLNTTFSTYTAGLRQVLECLYSTKAFLWLDLMLGTDED